MVYFEKLELACLGTYTNTDGSITSGGKKLINQARKVAVQKNPARTSGNKEKSCMKWEQEEHHLKWIFYSFSKVRLLFFVFIVLLHVVLWKATTIVIKIKTFVFAYFIIAAHRFPVHAFRRSECRSLSFRYLFIIVSCVCIYLTCWFVLLFYFA